MIAMVHAKVKNNKTKMHILIFKIINFPRLKRKIHYTNEIAWKIELNPDATAKTNDNNKKHKDNIIENTFFVPENFKTEKINIAELIIIELGKL